jgi:hypothetical protein
VNLVDAEGLLWEYSQSTGQLTHVDDATGARTPEARGYSGNGNGINNPNLQTEGNVGPIPQGTWNIGQQRDSDNTGRGVLPLTPRTGTDTFGRTDFQIHGDNSRRNNSASRGCIVIDGRNIRDRIANSGDGILRVVP